MAVKAAVTSEARIEILLCEWKRYQGTNPGITDPDANEAKISIEKRLGGIHARSELIKC